MEVVKHIAGAKEFHGEVCAHRHRERRGKGGEGADGKDHSPKRFRYNGRNESDENEDDARMPCITQCDHLLRVYSSSHCAAGVAP